MMMHPADDGKHTRPQASRSCFCSVVLHVNRVSRTLFADIIEDLPSNPPVKNIDCRARGVGCKQTKAHEPTAACPEQGKRTLPRWQPSGAKPDQEQPEQTLECTNCSSIKGIIDQLRQHLLRGTDARPLVGDHVQKKLLAFWSISGCYELHRYFTLSGGC